MKKMLGGAILAASITVGLAKPAPAQSAKSVLRLIAEAYQVNDDLFAGTEQFAKGASDVTEVNLDPRMLGMLGKTTSADLAHKMEFIVVHSYTYDKPGMYRMEDVDAYRRRLQDGSWSCFVHTRSKDGATDICQRTGSDNETHEMVILSVEPTELSFVHLKGRVTIDDLRKMGASMGGGSSMGSGPSGSAPPPPPKPPQPNGR